MSAEEAETDTVAAELHLEAADKAAEMISSLAKHVLGSGLAAEGRIGVMQTTSPDTGHPLLVVIPLKADPFLVDAPAVRLDVLADPETCVLNCRVVASPSREVVYTAELEEGEAAAGALETHLEQVCGDKYRSCVGYAEEDEGVADPFLKARKTDLPNMLIGKYDGQVIYRARSCAFVVEAAADGDDLQTRCLECRRLFEDLDVKYCSGRLTKKCEPVDDSLEIQSDLEAEPDSTKIEQGDIAVVKRKRGRGRPKKSKSKAYYSADFEAIPYAPTDPKRVKSEYEKEKEKENEEESSLAMEDDPTDADFKTYLRKSARRRATSKQVMAELMTKKRGRGRPPIVTDPTACKHCGKVFVILKDYKAHLV